MVSSSGGKIKFRTGIFNPDLKMTVQGFHSPLEAKLGQVVISKNNHMNQFNRTPFPVRIFFSNCKNCNLHWTGFRGSDMNLNCR